MQPDPPSCELLPWDTAFFGHRIARLTAARLDDRTVRRARDWCAAHQVACLFFLADATDAETLRLAAAAEFRLVDIRLTLDRSLTAAGPPPDHTPAAAPPPDRPPAAAPSPACSPAALVRRARADDLPALRSIAAASFAGSRFYQDGHFPAATCDRLYSAWVERFMRERPDGVLVAEAGGLPVGFVACAVDPAATGRIDLLGVSRAAWGRGVGGQLVAAALAWFLDRGAARATVVTQGGNVPAQRLYQAAGLRTRTVELWFHAWFGEDA